LIGGPVAKTPTTDKKKEDDEDENIVITDS
jgi:hypothetical protein